MFLSSDFLQFISHDDIIKNIANIGYRGLISTRAKRIKMCGSLMNSDK